MQIDKVFSRYAPIIPDFGLFMDFIQKPLKQSFRINTLKAKREEILLLLKDLRLKPLPFYKDGFLLPEKSFIGNHIAHILGLIYVQEVSSMLPVMILEPQPGEVVLDLCAAPGSKTTQIAQFMKNTGLVVANELNWTRIKGLIHNIKRCGLLNEVVINLRGEKIGKILPEYFDRILIDAPCSTEGTIRKSKAVLYHWGLKNIEHMAKIQKGLIVSGFRALRPGGVLVYSTCTLAPEENECVIAYLLQKFPEAEILPITIQNFKTRPCITDWQGETFDKKLKNCVRILPQDNDSAPFFIARITKCGIQKHRINYLGKLAFEGGIVEYFSRRFGIGKELFKDYSVFQERDTSYISTPGVYSFWEIKTIRKGLEFGKIYTHEVKPDNDFVQIFGKNSSRNYYETEEWQVQRFLKGDKIKVNSNSNISEGFMIVKYRNLPIGVGRYNGSEIKSEITRERRIQD